jgi:hypothetical protein
MPGDSGYLSIERERSISNALRGFTIMIDDQPVDKIRSGETKRYALPSGRHAVRIAIDFYKSRSLSFDLQPGQTLHLVCGDHAPRTLGASLSWRGIGQSIKVMTSPGDYLYIERTVAEPMQVAANEPDRTAGHETGRRPAGPAKRVRRTLFLSYRREDSRTITGRIRDRLTGHFGNGAVFRDVDSIPAGMDFREKIRETIDEADVLVAVVGPRWLDVRNPQGERRLDQAEDFVRLEIESAMAQPIPVIPVLVDDASMPRADQLPASIAQFAYRNALPIPQEPYFDAGMSRLIDQIERLDGDPPTADPRFCIACGKTLTVGQRFCTGCGRPAARA